MEYSQRKVYEGLTSFAFELRASVGYLGNINFNPYQALTTYSYNSSYFYGKGTGATPITIGNPDLKWERTLSTNIGVDFTAFRGRVDLRLIIISRIQTTCSWILLRHHQWV